MSMKGALASMHIFSHVLTVHHCIVSRIRAANIVRVFCSDSSHVTAPYKLSLYYYYYYYYTRYSAFPSAFPKQTVRITTNKPDTKYNTNPNPNPIKQHAVGLVSVHLNIVACRTYPEKFTRDMLLHRFN